MANLNNSTGSTIVLFYVVSGTTLVAVQPEPVILTITNFSGSIVNAGTVTFVNNGDPNWAVLAPFLTKALSATPPVPGSDGSLTLSPQTTGGSVPSLAALITSGTNVSGLVQMQESFGTDQATLTILLRGIRTLSYALDPLAAFLAKPVAVASNFHANVNSAAVNPRFDVALLGLTDLPVGAVVTANMEFTPATFPAAGGTLPMPFSIAGTLTAGFAYTATFGGGMLTVPADTVGPTVLFMESFAGAGVALKPWVGVTDTGTLNLPFEIRISDNYVFEKQSVAFTFRFRPRGATVTVGANGILTCAQDIVRTLTFTGAAWTPGITNPVSGSIPNTDVPALPFTLTVPADTGNVNPGASWTVSGTLSGLSGKFQLVELEVTVTDKAGNAFTRVQRTEIGVPSDVIALLDYSGSMSAASSVSSSETKWQRVLQAGTLFLDLFKALAPVIGTGGGGTAPVHQFRMGLFHWPSGALSVQPTNLPLQALTAPPTVLTDSAPNALTPITEALKIAKTSLTSAGAWRNRVTLLLTDGMQNRGTPDVGAYDSTTGGPPEPAPGEANAQRIHAIVYAPSNTTDEAALSDLCVNYDGQYRLIDDVGDFDELLELFVAALSDTIPVELVRAVSGTITIEEKVDKVVFVALTTSATNVVQRVGGTSPNTLATAVGADVHYAVVNDPETGPWEISGGGVPFFALVDLSLSVRFGVIADGVGRPATLWAEVRSDGEAVSGADIVVSVSRPGESAGQVIGAYLNSGGPRRTLRTAPHALTVASPTTHTVAPGGSFAVATNALHGVAVPTFSATVASALIATSPRPPSPDPLSLRRQLLTLAELDRGLELQFRKSPHRMTEVAPGKYRFVYTDTAVDGTYNFNFTARGQTPDGHNFQRDYRVSSNLVPIPAGGSQGTWTSLPLPGKKVQWTLTVNPVTQTKLPLGPGLAHALRFVPQKAPKDAPLLTVLDNLDGTYSTVFVLDAGTLPPALALHYPLRRPPSGAGPVPLPLAPPQVHRVKITLTRLAVKDDKEWLTRRGEFAFDAIVSLDGKRETAVRTRVPGDGVIRLASGEAVGLAEKLYEGFVAEGSRLTLCIGGAELDCFLLWQREEPLARYIRTFSGPIASWAGPQQPGDEAADPENLADWQLWYTVEVS